ncbi:MAG: septum site-determining protein MinD [Ruminococcaceae bacterium]|nr:septum site-determining protein MinD [Oscillospiraceae bacterium]
MGKIMLVTSGKGGTGKSTVALNLGLSLVKEGKKAVIIELDSGLRCLDIMLGIDDVVYDLGDALCGSCDISQAIYTPENTENLGIIAAPAKSDFMLSHNRFCTFCRHLCSVYDYVILDTPAGLGPQLHAAVSASSFGLVVTNISPVSVRDAEKAAELLKKAGMKNIRLVINLVPLEVEDKDQIPDLDDIIDSIGAQLIAVIPDDKLLKKCVCERKKKEERKSLGILAFENLAKRICGKDVPLIFK